MIKVLHRINTLDELIKVDELFGVEVDVHAYGEKLVVHHNAFEKGPELSDWMGLCGDRFVIFNLKEEGIEDKVIEMAVNNGISNFMLLDLSFPALIRMTIKGESRLAIRVSEYESVKNALLLESKIDWVWLDCFKGFPLSIDEFQMLKRSSFKICLVSPELHGSHRDKNEISSFKNILDNNGLVVDAVCTKFPELWG
jgi:hypothetical protein